MGLRGLKFESLVFREGLGFEALVSEISQIRGVVSEVLGLRRSWASAWASNCWAHVRLIHGPTVTPNFLVWKTMEISMCYGEWIKLSKLTLIPGIRRLSRLACMRGLVGQNFFPVKKISRRFIGSRRRRSFNVPILVVEVRPRVGVGVVERAAVCSSHNDQPTF
jgi:hypothetical protein